VFQRLFTCPSLLSVLISSSRFLHISAVFLTFMYLCICIWYSLVHLSKDRRPDVIVSIAYFCTFSVTVSSSALVPPIFCTIQDVYYRTVYQRICKSILCSTSQFPFGFIKFTKSLLQFDTTPPPSPLYLLLLVLLCLQLLLLLLFYTHCQYCSSSSSSSRLQLFSLQ
jgi:hypothetical protein